MTTQLGPVSITFGHPWPTSLLLKYRFLKARPGIHSGNYNRKNEGLCDRIVIRIITYPDHNNAHSDQKSWRRKDGGHGGAVLAVPLAARQLHAGRRASIAALLSPTEYRGHRGDPLRL